MNQRIVVWDIPTRVFHWLMVISFSGAFLTAESERFRDIHVMLGYTLLGLIAFRLVWGFIGSPYAKFRAFLFKPNEILAYLKGMAQGKPQRYLGHNPAGSVAIWSLLALSLTCGLTGVLLYQTVGGEILEEFHESLAYVMLGVVVLHIIGVVVSSLMHRENLARAMITGTKSSEAGAGAGAA